MPDPRSTFNEDCFNERRSYLFAIAYRMSGSVMDAEDILQEAYLRWQNVPPESIETPRAYLVSIVTRLCIDQMRSARARRETYIGPWLPEPLNSQGKEAMTDHTELAETLSTAFLILLESLSPVERAIFLLRQVFDYDYAEIAGFVGKSPANCRQLFHRARQRIAARRPRLDTPLEQQQRLSANFAQALTGGDMEGMLALLAEDIVLYSDGGGKVSAALNPIYGPDRVGRFLFGLAHKAPPDTEVRPAVLNGQPGYVVYMGGKLFNTITLDIRGGRIQNVYIVVNPDKLHGAN